MTALMFVFVSMENQLIMMTAQKIQEHSASLVEEIIGFILNHLNAKRMFAIVKMVHPFLIKNVMKIEVLSVVVVMGVIS